MRNRLVAMVLIVVLLCTSMPLHALAAELQNASSESQPTPRTPQIVGEAIEKREANIKHFLRDDGSYEAAVYPVSVHYRQDGKWRDIDNTLASVLSEDGTPIYANRENSYRVKLAESARAAKLVRIEKDGYELAWGLERAAAVRGSVSSQSMPAGLSSSEQKRTLTKLTSAVEYKNIAPGVDLRYLVEPEEVKEYIVLNQKAANPTFGFTVYVKGLRATLLADKSIVFSANDSGQEVFRMAAPFMVDAANAYSTDIDIALSQVPQGYSLQIRPSIAWLNAPERVYPVMIDPTVRTSLDPTKIYDNHVSSGYPTTNYILSYVLRVGWGSVSGINRSYIKFELPTLTTADLVVGADLTLYLTKANTNNAQVNAHKVTAAWNTNTITWNNRPSFDTRVEDYQLVFGIGYYKWDITSIAKGWYTSGANDGLMLKTSNDDNQGYSFVNEFYSSDVDLAHAAYRPQVSIFYVNNSGLENFWTYHAQSAGRAGTGYVNDHNGNLIFIHDTYALSGSKLPLTIKHIFNANERNLTADKQVPGMGPSWRLNLNQRVETQTIDSTLYYVYTDADGTKHYFSHLVNNRGTNELDGELTLELNAGGVPYTVSDKQSNRLLFDSAGRLTQIKDNNDATMLLSYTNGKLTTVTDGSGRAANLQYSGTTGLLERITAPDGTQTLFSYTGGRLTGITYPDNKVSRYEYYPNGSLHYAENYDGYKVSFFYYDAAPYRVSRILEHHTDNTLGQELSLTYGNNATTFTDVEGRKNYYTFNNAGNTISVQDTSGFARQYRYTTSGSKNKLTLESKLQRSVMNYVRNHSAETLTDWTAEANGGSTGTGNRSTLDKLYGNHSIRVNKTNTLGRHLLKQTVTLEKGKTYTLSAYVKTEKVSVGKGAYLSFYYQDSAGVWQNVDSAYIVGTIPWTRHEVTFTLPSNALSSDVQIHTGILEATGTAYFDGVQLEDGVSASRYNLLENPDFRYGETSPQAWLQGPHNDATDISGTLPPATHPTSLDTKAFRITGLANKSKYLYQVVNLAGKAQDTFVFAAWARGRSVPLAGPGRRFGLDVNIKYADGSEKWHYASFNADADEWQYITDAIQADKDYTQITLYICYYNNANNAFFDGLQLYREEFGTSYAYDDKGNLKSVESVAGQKQQFQFNNNDLTKFINPKGGEFNYVYDSARNVTKATSAENVVYNFTWAAGNVTKAFVGSDAQRIETEASYTTSGAYTRTIIDPSGKTVTYNWGDELKGLLQTFTDAKNIATAYTYDIARRLATATKDGAVNAYTYENDRLKTISHNGITYTFAYDSLGNNTKVQVGAQALITNVYQARTGRLLESTYGNGHKVVYGYDTLGRVSTVTYGTVLTYRYHYNAGGSIALFEDLANGVTHRYVYDLAERLVKVVDSNGNTTNYSYDGNNNTSVFAEKQSGASSPNLALHRPVAVSSTQSGSFPGSYAVDNNPSTRWSSQYSDPQWIYVDLGVTKAIDRVVLRWEGAYGKTYELQVSDDTQTWTSIYSTTNGTGGVDDIRNLTGAGRYVRMYGIERGTSYGYSLFELEVYGPVSTSYTFDKDNRQTKVALNTGGVIDYAYDALGRLQSSSVNTTTPHVTTYAYQAGPGAGLTTNLLQSLTNGSSTISYSYDNNSNIETITQNGQVIRYFYDNLNQLARENNQVLGKTITYTYDAGGNILHKKEYAYTTVTDLSGLTPQKTIAYTYDTTWKDKLVSYDGTAITYDSIGNPLNDGTYTYTWVNGRQLSTMTGPKTLSFKYNAAGLRTEKAVDGIVTTYRWVGDIVTHETNGTDTFLYYYDAEGKLVSFNLNGTDYFYVRNGQGDITGILNGAGTQVVTYVYDSWGKLVSTTGTLAATVGLKNPYRYRGYRYDTETGLYYLQSRYYNPEWGRFLNADGLIGQQGQTLAHNIFAYCGSNPVVRSDPGGQSWLHIGAMVAGAAIGLGATYMKYRDDPNATAWNYFDGVVYGAMAGLTIVALGEFAVSTYQAARAYYSAKPSVAVTSPALTTSRECVIKPTTNHSTVQASSGIPLKGIFGPKGVPNSSADLVKDNTLITRRFYGSNGQALRDIDFTNHGNSTLHPHVPHVHLWDRGVRDTKSWPLFPK